MNIILEKLSDPFVLVALVAIIFNCLLYRINAKAFKILYEKPRFDIKEISIKPYTPNGLGSLISDPHVIINIYNPSNFENLILSSTLRALPFGKLIHQNKANIPLAKFSRNSMHLSIEYNLLNKYKNKFVILTLIDIKKRKITKTFKLTDKN